MATRPQPVFRRPWLPRRPFSQTNTDRDRLESVLPTSDATFDLSCNARGAFQFQTRGVRFPPTTSPSYPRARSWQPGARGKGLHTDPLCAIPRAGKRYPHNSLFVPAAGDTSAALCPGRLRRVISNHACISLRGRGPRGAARGHHGLGPHDVEEQGRPTFRLTQVRSKR